MSRLASWALWLDVTLLLGCIETRDGITMQKAFLVVHACDSHDVAALLAYIAPCGEIVRTTCSLRKLHAGQRIDKGRVTVPCLELRCFCSTYRENIRPLND